MLKMIFSRIKKTTPAALLAYLGLVGFLLVIWYGPSLKNYFDVKPFSDDTELGDYVNLEIVNVLQAAKEENNQYIATDANGVMFVYTTDDEFEIKKLDELFEATMTRVKGEEAKASRVRVKARTVKLESAVKQLFSIWYEGAELLDMEIKVSEYAFIIAKPRAIIGFSIGIIFMLIGIFSFIKFLALKKENEAEYERVKKLAPINAVVNNEFIDNHIEEEEFENVLKNIKVGEENGREEIQIDNEK